MEKTVTISVTEDDLAKGKVGTTDESAVALAARRAFLGCIVHELPGCIDVKPADGPKVSYELPDEARSLTDMLERGDWIDAEPVTFTVERWDRPARRPSTVVHWVD